MSKHIADLGRNENEVMLKPAFVSKMKELGEIKDEIVAGYKVVWRYVLCMYHTHERTT